MIVCRSREAGDQQSSHEQDFQFSGSHRVLTFSHPVPVNVVHMAAIIMKRV